MLGDAAPKHAGASGSGGASGGGDGGMPRVPFSAADDDEFRFMYVKTHAGVIAGKRVASIASIALSCS